MSKILVPANCCYSGDILADDVMSNDDITLVVQNTVLNQYIKDKFIELQIPCIWLYEPAELISGIENDINFKAKKETYKDAVLNLKWVLNDLTAGDRVDYEKIEDISKSIDSSINDSSNIIKCLAEIKSSDEYTYTHSINVALYSMLIAKWLDLPECSIQEVIQAGLLHDIGKVKVPDEIINKNSRLTADEFKVIKKHPIYGYDLIKDLNSINENIKKAVLLHHERIDGSGYPFGYSGSSISLLAKIVSVADVYDAITQNRVYKDKATPFDAFEIFLTTGKSMFDTTVLNAFLKNMAAFYVGSNVILNNGDTGKIVYVPPQDILSPIISVRSNYIDLSRECNLKVAGLL
jgi:putative nucleotidyltransferase with HDIG domain